MDAYNFSLKAMAHKISFYILYSDFKYKVQLALPQNIPW